MGKKLNTYYDRKVKGQGVEYYFVLVRFCQFEK